MPKNSQINAYSDYIKFLCGSIMWHILEENITVMNLPQIPYNIVVIFQQFIVCTW